MSGICESCGKKAERLHTCPVCGAIVCIECLEGMGCKLCKGTISGNKKIS